MNILLDGMGGDNAPAEVVRGAVQAARELSDTVMIIGRQEEIWACLNKEKWNGNNIEVINAEEVISNNEAPAMAVRKKKDSSISKGVRLVKEGKADVFISAGSTGALMTAGLLILGRIKGVKRPAIASFFPRIDGSGPCILVDCGANVESKPEYILQNGLMGTIFFQNVKEVENPSVGLLNVGAEAEKGNELHKEAYALLEASSANFIGNVEGRDVMFGACDIVATDGFSGNVFLKASEGTALALMKRLKDKLLEGTASKIGALLAAGKLKEIKKDFDYTEEGGAPLLGIKGAILKIHGSSNAYAVYKAVLKAKRYVESDVTGKIEAAIEANSDLNSGKEER